jgi:hypothetical protein
MDAPSAPTEGSLEYKVLMGYSNVIVEIQRNIMLCTEYGPAVIPRLTSAIYLRPLWFCLAMMASPSSTYVGTLATQCRSPAQLIGCHMNGHPFLPHPGKSTRIYVGHLQLRRCLSILPTGTRQRWLLLPPHLIPPWELKAFPS